MIHVSCPKCGSKYHAPDLCAGRASKCRTCGSIIIIPGSPLVQPKGPMDHVAAIAAALWVIAAILIVFAVWWFVWKPIEDDARRQKFRERMQRIDRYGW